MDTMETATGFGPKREPERRPTLSRALLTLALACFALPFLTVTCYGGDAHVSGVQAATSVDIPPSNDFGEKELARDEPLNVIALFALIATAGGLALSFGSATSRQTAVWAAAAAAIALEGLYLYAVDRSWGDAFPDIGLSLAITLLIAAAWSGVDTVPRWVVGVGGVAALAMIAFSLLDTGTQDSSPFAFLAFYAGSIVSVALAVGAIRASVAPAVVRTVDRSWVRIAIAGGIGLGGLAAVGVAAPILMGMLDENGSISSSYVFALVADGLFVASSVVAWIAGRRIVHGRRGSGAVSHSTAELRSAA